MNPVLQDLFGHQFWADVTLWQAIAAHPPARDDKAIRDRLHHIHLVQRAFMWMTGDQAAPFVPTKPEAYPTFDALREYARQTHAEIHARVAALTDARLDASISPPWFKDPPLTLTVTEALTQCAMHSHHHRAQNATRLRELGSVPPLLDLIVWYWKGRPDANW